MAHSEPANSQPIEHLMPFQDVEPPEDAQSQSYEEYESDSQPLEAHSGCDTYATDNNQGKALPNSAKEKLSRLLDGKEEEWAAVTEKKGPLNLLDLPVDILKEIIQHLPHTNDLTSLALTHSALHTLTVSHIYARFDIVWPDETSTSEQRSGVDALTYGLATLVMAEELFQDSPKSKRRISFPRRLNRSPNPYPIIKRRRGNYYAQYTKKFSLGNGPPEYVQEYLISKEGGKMLGTLVAIAIARMRNLETFVWDMPTGVLGDIWMALSSLADDDSRDCPLDRLWIRWHDNRPEGQRAAVPPPPMALGNVPPPPTAPNGSGTAAGQPAVVVAHPNSQAIDRVEHPTFSVIPPLESLSVLDVDELPYLDEMSILVARSRRKLRELRVGIARHAQAYDWASNWDEDTYQQVDYNTDDTAASTVDDRRLGGVLGVLVGRVYNMRRTPDNVSRILSQRGENVGLSVISKSGTIASNITGMVPDRDHHDNNLTYSSSLSPSVQPPQENTQETETSILPREGKEASPSNAEQHVPPTGDGFTDEAQKESFLRDRLGPDLREKLRLETLELERVQIFVPVMLNAFDWTILTSLTLLNCQQHENLWRALRFQYSPMSKRNAATTRVAHRSDYQLNLKKVHTNTVSQALVSFLKESLAPNSLEVLFLQEGRGFSSTVTVETIYKGPIKRHRASLKKLMIDSSERGPDGVPTMSTKWRRWMVNREILMFITSGKMKSLRELAIVIDYRDWHFFLQHLQYVPHLRSLYVPHIADHIHGNNIEPRELALQIVDIVHLKPEIEICYMGLSTKCFEILENRSSSHHDRRDSTNNDGTQANSAGGYVIVDPDSDGEEADSEDEEDEDDMGDEDGDAGDEDGDADSDGITTDESDAEHDSLGDLSRRGPRLRLREILFYDDKVAIFRARHGRL